MKICLNCGNASDIDMQYCDVCGKDKFQFTQDVACPHCGAVNMPTNVYCNSCGKSLAVVEEQSSLTKEQDAIRNQLSENYTATQLASVEVKETSTCPNCGNEVQINAIFCYECGTPIYAMNDHKVVTRKICSICGTPNLMSSSMCSQCYANLDGAALAEYQVVHEVNPTTVSNMRYAVLRGENDKHLMCNSCGAINDFGSELCAQCGIKLRMEDQIKYCPSCGNANQPTSQFCTSCRAPLAGYDTATTADEIWVCERCDSVNTNNDDFCTNCGSKHRI